MATSDGVAQQEDHSHHEVPQRDSTSRYARTVRAYDPPDVTLVDQNGVDVALSGILRHEGPLLLQFIFTTCPAVCPILSGTFAAARKDFEPGTRMVSISIDPEHDTPARLWAYAKRFEAGSDWRFLTGKLQDVEQVQKAFGAYRGNKMQHEPLTFLRAAAGDLWVRLDGFLSAADLVGEVRRQSLRRQSLRRQSLRRQSLRNPSQE